MSDGTISYRIEPLKSPENYPTWSIQLQDILTEANLWPIVSGETPRPPAATDGTTTASDNWNTKDKKALTAIRTRVSSAMITYVINATTSRQAWDSLKSVFDVQGPIAIIIERRRLFRYAIPEGSDMEEHLRILRTCSEKLSLLQSPVPDDEFKLVLLTALPESWDPFVASITIATTTSTQLIGRILQEDARRRSRSGPTAFPAFNHYGNPPGLPGAQGSKPQNFGNRNQGGNGNKYNSRNNNNRRSNQGSKNKKGNNRGFNSGNQNTQRNSNPNSNSNNSNSNKSDTPNYSFIALAATIPPSPKWIGDSATQAHTCTDRNLFDTYVTTPGKTISGVGSADVLGTGTVKIHFVVDGELIPITLTDVLHVPSLPHHLISMGRLTDGTGLSYYGIDNDFEIIDTATQLIIGRATKVNNLYEFDVEVDLPSRIQSFPLVPIEPGMIGTSPWDT